LHPEALTITFLYASPSFLGFSPWTHCTRTIFVQYETKATFFFVFLEQYIYIYIYKNLRRVLINYTFWIWFVRWGHECSTMVCVKQTIFENAWKYIKIIYFYIWLTRFYKHYHIPEDS
jgi:hypothetical protein